MPKGAKLGHSVSEETKKRISNSLKGNIPWNKGLLGYHPKGIGFKKGHIPWNKDLKVRTNTGKTHFPKGKSNPHWKGGISSLTERIRSCDKYLKWRADVFKRDGWTCQTCGLRGHGRDIEAHHIKPMKEILEKIYIKGLNIDDLYFLALTLDELFDVSNGITLCKHCHILTYKTKENKNA